MVPQYRGGRGKLVVALLHGRFNSICILSCYSTAVVKISRPQVRRIGGTLHDLEPCREQVLSTLF